jgi:hypothetical protein
MTSLFTVELTAEEMLLLDGKCGQKVQASVDLARNALAIKGETDLSASEAKMIAKILAYAKENGALRFMADNISHCPCCDHREGYYTHKRAGRYHAKGQIDPSKPKTFRAWDVTDDFIRIRNSIRLGFCEFCRERVEPVLVKMLAGIQVQPPKHWEAMQPRWEKQKIMHCLKCDWRGSEDKMTRRSTLMGDGTYPSGCPECRAENTPLGKRLIEDAGEFIMIEKGER